VPQVLPHLLARLPRVELGEVDAARDEAPHKGEGILAAALGLTFLIALVAFIMAVLVVIGLWWVGLIVLLLLVLLAGFIAWRGIGRVTSTKFTPEETIASVKEEIEWAKNRLLRRG